MPRSLLLTAGPILLDLADDVALLQALAATVANFLGKVANNGQIPAKYLALLKTLDAFKSGDPTAVISWSLSPPQAPVAKNQSGPLQLKHHAADGRLHARSRRPRGPEWQGRRDDDADLPADQRAVANRSLRLSGRAGTASI